MSKNTFILVAESNLSSVFLIEDILSKAKLGFDLVCTVTEAVEQLEECKYDLVILSLVSCVNEKIKLDNLITKITKEKTPLLIVSESFPDHIQEVGFPNCDYIQRPIAEKELLKKISLLSSSK
jgi:DNA-binding response OmpR family regulator